MIEITTEYGETLIGLVTHKTAVGAFVLIELEEWYLQRNDKTEATWGTDTDWVLYKTQRMEPWEDGFDFDLDNDRTPGQCQQIPTKVPQIKGYDVEHDYLFQTNTNA